MQQEFLKASCAACSSEGLCEKKFHDLLRSSGGRLTKERKSLLTIVCDIKGHFQPQNLLAMLRRRGYPVSLTTVYRNLSLLVRAGIIRRTDVQEGGSHVGARYEHVWGRAHHDHLVCSRCGRRVEFSYSAIDALQEVVAAQHGFSLERHTLELVGVCPDCRTAESGRRAAAGRTAR
jgi:Fur family transcriptional regulator, ferric uptake regulator